MNIMNNKGVTFNNKDAPCIMPAVKTAIKRNSKVYRKWVKRGRKQEDQNMIREARNGATKLIKEVKLSFYSNLASKLSDAFLVCL